MSYVMAKIHFLVVPWLIFASNTIHALRVAYSVQHKGIEKSSPRLFKEVSSPHFSLKMK